MRSIRWLLCVGQVFANRLGDGAVGGDVAAELVERALVFAHALGHCLAEHDLPGAGDLDPLLRALVGLHLRHEVTLLSVAAFTGCRCFRRQPLQVARSLAVLRPVRPVRLLVPPFGRGVSFSMGRGSCS